VTDLLLVHNDPRGGGVSSVLLLYHT